MNSDRERALTRTFQAAFAALTDFCLKDPEAAGRIAEHIAGHLRGSHPEAGQPIASIECPLSSQALYGIRAVDGMIELYLRDDTGHDAAIQIPRSQAEYLRNNIARVLASEGK